MPLKQSKITLFIDLNRAKYDFVTYANSVHDRAKLTFRYTKQQYHQLLEKNQLKPYGLHFLIMFVTL